VAWKLRRAARDAADAAAGNWPFVGGLGVNWRRRTLKRVRYLTYLLSRVRRHAATLPGMAGGAIWWMRTIG
jgi:hypothetical protein